MSKIFSPVYTKVRREEYIRLKKLEKYFESFWSYFTHLRNIQDAREDVKKGRTVPQEKLFKKYGRWRGGISQSFLGLWVEKCEAARGVAEK